MNLNSSRRTMVIGGVIACLLLALGVATVISSAANPATASPAVRYVKPTASGSENCSDWANACTLQNALVSATAGEEIWVAEGTHKPGALITATFQLTSGVALYGGFVGTESSLEDRDWRANITVLSGDIDNNDITDPSGVITTTTNIVGSNSYHLVTGSDTDATAVLDGFTVTGGEATGSLWDEKFGGGMFGYNCGMSLVNDTFSGNSAAEGGGGLYINTGSPKLTNVIFSGNSADYGGGMRNDSSSPTLTNVAFSGNSAASYGGGMNNYLSSPTLVNVTFSGNSASYGGGMYNVLFSSPALTNCILWGNTAPNGPQIYNAGTGSTTVTYSDIQGDYSGTGNIDADPLFVRNPDPGDGDWTTPGDNDYGDLRLQLTSPGIDVGDNTAVPVGITTDLGGNPRISNGVVDMGAYEAPPDHLCVDQDAAGSNEGTCWAGAFNDLQDALTWAVEGVQIWVAEGTYKPGTDRADSFRLLYGVELYGGFEGNETASDQRDWTLHETILSGDIGTPDDPSDNSYHVVTGSGTDATAVLDGFAIRGGNADGIPSPTPNDRGGGLYINTGSPKLTNVIFSGNSAAEGGGMSNNNATPTLVNVTFSGNSAAGGGGMSNNNATPTLVNVTFSGNSASYGGGMYNYLSSPTLVNVTFSGNSASYGGGMYNVLFISPALTNCILWGNTAPNGPQIYNAGTGSTTVTYSDIQGGYSGTGNINADPEFVDPDGADDIVGTLDDDLRLQLTSPAIDVGDNTAVPVGITTDLDGNPRIVNGVVDMGAYEAQLQIYLPLVLKN